jgi:hypothetical protein
MSLWKDGCTHKVQSVGRDDLDAAGLIESASALLDSQFLFLPVEGQRWNRLEVRLDAARERTHGTGENPLHVDYLAHASPPRFIALLCLRPDPAGGGATQLSSFANAVSLLPKGTRQILETPWFWYWPDPTGGIFGNPVDPFPILPKDPRLEATRFSAKMIRGDGRVKAEIIRAPHEDNAGAVCELNAAMQAGRIDLLLRRGELLVFDQFSMAHGRSSLGPFQSGIDKSHTRLLMQAYLSPRGNA